MCCLLIRKFVLLFICFIGFLFSANGKQFQLEEVNKSKNFKRNIQLLEQELNKPRQLNEEERLKLQASLINNYIADRRYKVALKFCQSEILGAQKLKQTLTESNLYISLARCYYYLNQKEKVVHYNNKALQIAQEYNYPDVIKRCNHNLGVIALEYQYNVFKARDYFSKAIEVGKKLPQTKENNNVVQYRLLGTCYDLLKDFKKADSIFIITENLCRLYSDSLGLSDALTFHARSFMSQKQYKLALQLLEEAYKIAKQCKNLEYRLTTLSMKEQVYVALKDYEKAYAIKTEIFELNISENAQNQKEEIAEAEARFKVAELQNKQEVQELKNKQTQRNYLFIYILVFVVTLGVLLFFYQRRLNLQRQQGKLENLKQVFEAEERERTRIAKDLHDNMGAYTTSLLSQIELIEMQQGAEAQGRMAELRADAENIMTTLRETIWILKNKMVTVSQFYDLIKIYGDKHLVKNAGINVSYLENVMSESKFLNSTVSLNVYRIVQENLQNVVKHSCASKVQFEMTSYPRLRMVIRDNGKGFEMDKLKRKSGIEHMQQRALEINFHFGLTSVPGEGTCMVLEEMG